MVKKSSIKIIHGPEWKKFQTDLNKVIFTLPQDLVKDNEVIANELFDALKRNAPEFSGFLKNSIELKKGTGKKRENKFFITVTAPHAFELVAGPFSQRRVYRDMVSYSGRTFGEWLDEHGMGRFDSLLVGGPNTMFGRYDELWWELSFKEMISFINTKFPQMGDRIIRRFR